MDSSRPPSAKHIESELLTVELLTVSTSRGSKGHLPAGLCDYHFGAQFMEFIPEFLRFQMTLHRIQIITVTRTTQSGLYLRRIQLQISRWVTHDTELNIEISPASSRVSNVLHRMDMAVRPSMSAPFVFYCAIRFLSHCIVPHRPHRQLPHTDPSIVDLIRTKSINK